MKINGIEIRKEPFTDEYLDDVIQKSDLIITLPKNLDLLIKISKEYEIIYIHEYTDRYTLGVKIEGIKGDDKKIDKKEN